MPVPRMSLAHHSGFGRLACDCQSNYLEQMKTWNLGVKGPLFTGPCVTTAFEYLDEDSEGVLLPFFLLSLD